MTYRRALIAAAAAAVLALPAAALVAQEKRASPHETVKAVIDGASVSFSYGRPFA